MSERPNISALVSLARRVDAVIAELNSELDTARNPNNLALRSLGVDRLGWTPSVYSDEAFQIWSQASRKDPSDPEALHHLAIMHHARAIDLEETEDPTAADSDWIDAMRLWFLLWENDAFWESLTESVCQGGKTGPVEELRRDCPQLLLGIHFDLAVDPATRKSRINFHIEQALASPFPEVEREKARNLAYERFAAQIPESIWQASSPEIAEAENALGIIREFLEKDPGCGTALADALNISVKVLRTRSTDINAVSEDDSERLRLLTYLKELADAWWPYFVQLAQKPDAMEEDARRNLCLWCRVNGEVMQAKDLYDDAIRFLRLGAAAGSDDDDEARKCQRKMTLFETVRARNMVEGNPEDARTACDSLRKRHDLAIGAHVVLAQAYLWLDESGLAEEVCAAGLKKEPDFDNHQFTDEDEHGLQNLEELRNTILANTARDEAREWMDAGEHEEAVRLLDKALDLEPDSAIAYFLRARCRIAMLDPDAASEDVVLFCDHLGDNADGLAAAGRLNEEIKGQRESLAMLGREALRLEREANRAFGQDDAMGAIDLLRQALDVVQPDGRPDIEEKLATVLCAHGISEVNRIMENKSYITGRAGRLKKCRQMLAEACGLDPTNDHAQDNMKALDELLENVEVNELRMAAGIAFKAEKFSEAVRHQKAALAIAKPADRKPIQEGLAAIMTGQAVTMVNNQSDPSSFGILGQLQGAQLNGILGREAVFRQSLALLEKAAKLDPQSSHIKKNLMAVRRLVAGQ